MKKLALAGALALVVGSALAQTAAPDATEAAVSGTLQHAWDIALVVGAKIVAVSAIAASALPPAGAGKTWATIRGVIDFIAFNFGHAKNADK